MRKKIGGITPQNTIVLSVLFILVTAAVTFAALRVGDVLYSTQQWVYGILLGIMVGGLVTAVMYTLLPAVRETTPRAKGTLYYPLIAGALALCAMTLAYVTLGVWPVGNESVMIVDMHHQYGPLLAQLRSMILGGGDVLYTFNAGIGANFLSLFAYYLASPLNLLLVLFPAKYLCEGILVITLIKNMLSAVFFAACIQYVLRRRDVSVVILAVSYAMSMYMLAYSWNIMWLDGVMMLPLVVLGFERMMRTGKYGVYVLTLAYVLFTNYYIGFMVCVFMVLYYIAFAIRIKRSLETHTRAFLRFTVGSLIGGGLAMCLLLPVYFALGYTSAAGDLFPDFSSNFALFKLFGQQLFGATPTIRSGNLPNVYCGILPLILLPLFVTTRTIPLRRRIAFGGLLGVLTLSFTFNAFDFLWHGMHTPNDLPYRFSFLFVFALLFVAAMLFEHVSDITPRQITAAAATFGVAVMLFEMLQKDSTAAFMMVYVSLLLGGVYTVVLLLSAYKKIILRTAYMLLLAVVCFELTVHGGIALDTLNGNEYYTDHSSYLDNDSAAAMQAAIDTAKDIAEKENPNSFYRLEMLPRHTCVDTALYNYRGLTSFSSSNYYHTTRLLGALGFAHNGVNSYMYESFVPAVDSLLGVKYITTAEPLDSPLLQQVGESTHADTTYRVYKNTLALPLGYRVSTSIDTFKTAAYQPFTTGENLLAAMTDDSRGIYTYLPIQVAGDSTDIASTMGTQINLSVGGGTAWFTATADTAGDYYVYIDCSAAESASLSVQIPDGSEPKAYSPSTGEPYIIYVGNMPAGTIFDVSVTADDAVGGHIYIAKADTAVMTEKLTTLQKDGLQVTEMSDSVISGNITATANGVLFTSIPYDEGWEVTVDGKATPTYPIGDLSGDGDKGAFLALDIGIGTHAVTFRYTPKGLKIGVLLTAVSVLAFIILLLVTRTKKTGMPAVAQTTPDTPAAPAPIPDITPSPAVPDTTSTETLSENVSLSDILNAAEDE